MHYIVLYNMYNNYTDVYIIMTMFSIANISTNNDKDMCISSMTIIMMISMP